MPELGASHQRTATAMRVRARAQQCITRPAPTRDVRTEDGGCPGKAEALPNGNLHRDIWKLQQPFRGRVEESSPRRPTTVAMERGRGFRRHHIKPLLTLRQHNPAGQRPLQLGGRRLQVRIPAIAGQVAVRSRDAESSGTTVPQSDSPAAPSSDSVGRLPIMSEMTPSWLIPRVVHPVHTRWNVLFSIVNARLPANSTISSQL